jgi:hypothetical protein
MDITELISKFTDPLYLKYIEILNSQDEYIKINDNKIIVDKYIITIPIIKNLFERQQEIIESRISKLCEIYLLKEQIIQSNKPHNFQKQYDNLLESIQKLDDEFELLKKYYIKINHIMYGFKTEELEKELYKKKYNSKDLFDDKKKIVKKFIKNKDLYLELKNSKNHNIIDYYIVTLPHIVNKSKNEKIIKKVDLPKELPTKLSPKQKQQITNNIKNILIDKFKFKNKGECISKAKSKEYYMSKEELIKIIDDNPDIKLIMPSNYKSLTKEKICEILNYKN